jgi:sugar phosphate isomerase/epimerase
MRKIGFSQGVMHKKLDPCSKESIKILRSTNTNAIEVHYRGEDSLNRIKETLKQIKEFKYRSMHAPSFIYRDNQETRDLLDKVVKFYNLIGASLAVVHPDKVENWNVFNNYPDINWAVENMDEQKDRYTGVKDFVEFFKENDNWGMVLDLGHCKANDKTMKLAQDFIDAFKDRIKEIHLSGYEILHEPLFRTKQKEIIKPCNQMDVPIIIESTFEIDDSKEEVLKEFNYILESLNE